MSYQVVYLTASQRKLLSGCAGFVLAGEWPFAKEKCGDRDALLDAIEKLNRPKAAAFGEIMDALRKANQFLHDNAPEGDETLALTSRVLRQYGGE